MMNFEKKLGLVAGLLSALLAAGGPARASFEGQLQSMGAKIVSDLPTFLYDNFHECTTNMSPLYTGRRYEVSSNLFPSFLPWGELNLAGKAQVKREHGYWPQVDVLAGGWFSLIASFLPADVKEDVDPSIFGYNLGLIVTESLDPRLRLFFGYDYSQLRVKASLQELKDEEDEDDGWDFIPDDVDVGKGEHYMVLGAELLRNPDKRLVTQIGYGLSSNRFTARLMWCSKRFDTGLIFFPEGYPLILWPVMNVQVRF
jgi:hypothetical protein